MTNIIICTGSKLFVGNRALKVEALIDSAIEAEERLHLLEEEANTDFTYEMVEVPAAFSSRPLVYDYNYDALEIHVLDPTTAPQRRLGTIRQWADRDETGRIIDGGWRFEAA